MERFTGTTMYVGESIRRGSLVATIHPDDDMGAEPWLDCDGDGVISEWTRRGKNPGERILASHRGMFRYYDIAATMAIAKRDGWDSAPYGQGTAGERAARATWANFNRWRAWYRDEWQFVGVAVTDRNGDVLASLWGIESDSGADYFNEIADELFDEATPHFKSRRVMESAQ